MKKLIILLCFITAINKAQNKDPVEIKVKIDVYLNNKKVETDSIKIILNNTYVYITDSFYTYLSPNKQYKFILRHPNYKDEELIINTFKVVKNEYKVYLKQI